MKSCRLVFIVLVFTCFSCEKDPDQPVSLSLLNLVSKITFDDGNAYDEMTGKQGIVFNALIGDGHYGISNKAMYFSRNDSSYIDFGDDSAYSFPQNIFTISCWVLLYDTSSSVSILSKRNATGPFEFSIDNHMNHDQYNFDNWIANGGTTVYGTDPLNAGTPIALNQWQHVAFVADGVLLQSYLNGELSGTPDSVKAGNFFSDTDASFQIGVGGGYGKHYFMDGAIDDIRIFKRALTGEEIKSLYKL